MLPVILTDPTPEELFNQVKTRLAKANKSCRTRTIPWSEELAIVCESAILDDSPGGGVYQDDGGSVCNHYHQRAGTTLVFLAWCRENSCLKVGIAVGRVRARHQSYGQGPGVSRFSGTPEEAIRGIKLPSQFSQV